MILSTVEGINIKGRSFKHELCPATIISGPNFVGKTAIVEAIRLSLLGFIPELGKTNPATWQLASGEVMMVGVTFEPDGLLRRKYARDGERIKCDVLAEGTAQAVALEALPLLDNAAYFEMTDSQRVEYAFRMLKLGEDYNRDTIIAECQRIVVEAHSDLFEEAKQEIIADAVDRAFGTRASPAPLQQALSDSIEALRSRFTYYNTRKRDTQGAVRTLSELRTKEAKVVRAARDAEPELRKADAAIGRIREQMGKVKHSLLASGNNARRKQEIRGLLNEVKVDYAKEIASSETHKEGATKQILTELSEQETGELEARLIASRTSRAELVAQIERHTAAIKQATDRKWKLEALVECPFCKSHNEGWKERVSNELAKTITEEERKKKEATGNLGKQEKRIKEIEDRLRENKAVKINNLHLRNKIQSIDNELVQLASKADSHETRKKLLAAELARLEETEELPLPTLESLEEQLAAAQVKRKETEALIDEETRLRQDIRMSAKSELEHRRAGAGLEATKAIADVLKSTRETLIAIAFADVLGIANRIFNGVIPELAFHEGEIGRWRDEKFISHKTFSGTEKALCYIAIATALSSKASLRLVILDEFGRLDEKRRRDVIHKLSEAVTRELIDQFIVVGTELPKGIDPLCRTAFIDLNEAR